MPKPTARGELKKKQEISLLVEHIISEIKEENKVILNDLEDDKNDLVLSIMDKIEYYSNKKDFISEKTLKKIDKNEVCINIYIGLFPELEDKQKQEIEKAIRFVINHKILRKPKNFF